MLKTANERLLKSMSKDMYFSAIFCLFLLLFLAYTDQGNLYVHFTNRFHVAMCQFSNRSHMTSKCGKKQRSGTQGSEFFKNSILFYYTFKIFLQQRAQKFGRFLFVHILSHRFNPIRSQLETVLDFWLVYVGVKEYELMWGHIFGLLAVTTLPHRKLFSKFWPIFRPFWAYFSAYFSSLVNKQLGRALKAARKRGWSMVYFPCNHRWTSFLSQYTIKSMVYCSHLPNLINASWLWRNCPGRGALSQSDTNAITNAIFIPGVSFIGQGSGVSLYSLNSDWLKEHA